MVWLLSTYNRPEMCQEALDACAATQMTSTGVLFVDAPTDDYRNLRFPPNWVVMFAYRHYDFAPSLDWCFRRFPNEDFYGWISDDHRPRTMHWDKIIEERTGPFEVSCCRDLHFSEIPGTRDGVLSGAMGWGGEIVRAAGWWALPRVQQAGIDDAWYRMSQALGCRRYFEDVVVEHISYRNDKRPKDQTDEWVRDGVPYINQDFALFNQWAAHGGGMGETVERIQKAQADWNAGQADTTWWQRRQRGDV